MFKTIELGSGCHGEGCDGSGIREDVVNGQVYDAENKPRPDEQIVERCDICDKYADDFEAAKVRFERVRWIISIDGFHSVAASGRRCLELAVIQ